MSSREQKSSQIAPSLSRCKGNIARTMNVSLSRVYSGGSEIPRDRIPESRGCKRATPDYSG